MATHYVMSGDPVAGDFVTDGTTTLKIRIWDDQADGWVTETQVPQTYTVAGPIAEGDTVSSTNPTIQGTRSLWSG